MIFNQKKPLILIVDDEIFNIEILREIVEKYSEVIATKNPIKAIELAEKFKPDLILLDIMMPNMDGWELCRHLKSNPSTAQIGVFFVTAKIEPSDRVKSFQVGAQDYLTKPLLALEVEARVKGFLARKQEEDFLKQQLEHTRKMEAIGTLAGGILHDINNILTPIFGYLQILMSRITGKESEMLSKIFFATQRLADLSRQILNFSRKSDNKKETLRLKIQIKEIVKLLKIGFPKTVEFSLTMSDKPLKIKADLTAIHQVVINLCVNAVHAMNGKGLIKISLDEVALPLSSNLYVKLTVQDEGCGMDKETIARIFEPFYTTKKNGEGTGLGLATVKSIVEEHQGKIVVESEKGKGSAFHLFFPSIEQLSEQPKYPQSKIEHGTESVMIVDNEKDIVESISVVLSEAGYNTIGVTKSDEVIKVFSNNKVDIVVMDVEMPGELSGLDLEAGIRKINPSIPIIFCPGYLIQNQNELSKNRYNYLLYKPFSPYELCRMIRKCLG
ncbi:MAG: response regulator [Desulfamplus sp.]|nr:response regulator [Desulfamplus sp.]